jgi:hypothetical protein
MGTIKFANIGHVVDVAAFRGLHGIRYDLDSAAQMAEYLLKALESGFPEPIVFDGLCTALVVRYSRAFVGGIRDSQHCREALASLTDEQCSVHESLLTMRNKHIAHSVNAQEENWVVAQYYEERVQEEGFVGVSVSHGRTVGFGNEELRMIADTARALLARIDERIKIEEERLLPAPKALDAMAILAEAAEIEWTSKTADPEKRRKKP